MMEVIKQPNSKIILIEIEIAWVYFLQAFCSSYKMNASPFGIVFQEKNCSGERTLWFVLISENTPFRCLRDKSKNI